MKILFGSDFHGHRGAFSAFATLLRDQEYDCAVLAGDMMTHFNPDEIDDLLAHAGIEDDDIEELTGPDESSKRESAKEEVLHSALKNRAQELQAMLAESGKPVYFIMGNDDGIVAGGYEWPTFGPVQNINQCSIQLGRWRFIGYQFTPPFVGGLFEKPEEQQRENLFELANLFDERTILVTHGPPRGILDGNEFGGVALRRFVDMVRPRVHLFGHIHQSAGFDWPFINGAFPSTRSFVSIDIERGEAVWLPM